MQALYQKGVNFDLTTCVQPNTTKLENAYGSTIASIVKKAERINILESLEEPVIERIIQKGNYDFTINTHGDTLPFYHHSLLKHNALTYCHFPSAKYHIESENLEYLRDIRVGGEGFSQVYDKNHSKNSNVVSDLDLETKQKVKKYFEFLRVKYDSLMKNTLVLANSEYTRRAITHLFNTHPKVIYPPVDVETFRKAALQFTRREDMILVISRIAPDKEIENAIELAKILRNRGIRKDMVIAGNLHQYDDHYYQQLKKMIADYDLSEYVSLQTNISFSKLIQLMQVAKVYFHPRIEEHFGISIVEAMASGLVPVVSDVGGHTEFVPPKYHFHTLEYAADLVDLAFEATTESERLAISNSTSKFSNANYVKSFHRILSESLSDKDIN
jgi:glycosyltransferase involved in cell wall biosynthesis